MGRHPEYLITAYEEGRITWDEVLARRQRDADEIDEQKDLAIGVLRRAISNVQREADEEKMDIRLGFDDMINLGYYDYDGTPTAKCLAEPHWKDF